MNKCTKYNVIYSHHKLKYHLSISNRIDYNIIYVIIMGSTKNINISGNLSFRINI